MWGGRGALRACDPSRRSGTWPSRGAAGLSVRRGSSAGTPSPRTLGPKTYLSHLEPLEPDTRNLSLVAFGSHQGYRVGVNWASGSQAFLRTPGNPGPAGALKPQKASRRNESQAILWGISFFLRGGGGWRSGVRVRVRVRVPVRADSGPGPGPLRVPIRVRVQVQVSVQVGPGPGKSGSGSGSRSGEVRGASASFESLFYTHHAIVVFESGGAAIIVFANGGLRPPQPPRFC